MHTGNTTGIAKNTHTRVQVAKASPIARRIFGLAFAARNAARKRGEATPFWNFLVFDKIRT